MCQLLPVVGLAETDDRQTQLSLHRRKDAIILVSSGNNKQQRKKRKNSIISIIINNNNMSVFYTTPAQVLSGAHNLELCKF